MLTPRRVRKKPMPGKRLLLISNSTNYGATYLAYTTRAIKNFPLN